MNYKVYYSNTGIPKNVSQEGNKAYFKITPKLQSVLIQLKNKVCTSFQMAVESLNSNTSINRIHEDDFLNRFKFMFIGIKGNKKVIAAKQAVFIKFSINQHQATPLHLCTSKVYRYDKIHIAFAKNLNEKT